MYGGWPEYVVLWTHFLWFIWDVENVTTTYIYWVSAQSRHSKSWFWMGTFPELFLFKLLNSDDKICKQNSTV